MMEEVKTLSNGCSVAEIARKGERFDSTAMHRKEDAIALRRHERWNSTFKEEESIRILVRVCV